MKCLTKSMVCDGGNYCTKDENKNAPPCTIDECYQNGRFYCNISRKCIPEFSVCDGIYDCLYTEDEVDPACTKDECQNERYYCNRSTKSITGSSVCDGISDCIYTEDEVVPACISKKCIHKRSICDGAKDCLGGEDEVPPACTSKKCILMKRVCDGAKDCLGGEDEAPPACSKYNRQLNERIEPRRVFPVVVRRGQQPYRYRRRQSSSVYADINEETMEHYHYICEHNSPDHYDKVKDRQPCICSQCVEERVRPMADNISSGSSTIFVQPYATGGGSISSHSYVSNSAIHPRRIVTHYDSDSGLVRTKYCMDKSIFRRSVTRFEDDEFYSTGERKSSRRFTKSESDMYRICEKDNTKGINPRCMVAKHNRCIELVGTLDYMDIEALYQKTKSEDKRKLAAKYLDEGEEIFGFVGQIEREHIQANEVKECELLNNEIDNRNQGEHKESSSIKSQTELVEENFCADHSDLDEHLFSIDI
ncbi:LRP2-like protein [Mya arenaria]|uniref:LRP2-like protein n=1 Tax=Mya arenaria TaxID=6604 RepID=A0ABY7DC58_MYAAR|nr:LRP2-like protein [Mya arenaria]